MTFEYNLQGTQIKIVDPDAGTIESEYNGFGEMINQKQKIHSEEDVVTTYSSPKYWLLDEINLNGEITKHTYDSKSRLKTISIAGVHSKEYEYDDFNRHVSVSENIEVNKSFVFSAEYDAYGRVNK